MPCYLKVKYVVILIDLYCLLVVTLHYAEKVYTHTQMLQHD